MSQAGNTTETSAQPPSTPTTSLGGAAASASSPSTGRPRTSSREAAALRAAAVRHHFHTMLAKLAAYLAGEIELSTSDYELLTQLNQMAVERYKGASVQAQQLMARMRVMQDNYEKIKPHLEQVDTLHETVGHLESVVDRLDEYTKQLEERFVRVYKQS